MATLKGLFDPKPRSKRNFLLENKREVKVRSLSNSKPKVTTDLPQKQRKSWMACPSPQYPSKIEHSGSNASIGEWTSKPKVNDPGLRHTASTSLQSKREPPKKFNLTSSKQAPKGEASSCFKKTVTGSQTVNYSDQENVPFQWTEMCPSLISHSICHQSVQTEDCNSETYEQHQGTENVVKIDNELDRHSTKTKRKIGNDSGDGQSRTGVSTKDSCLNYGKMEVAPKLSSRVDQVSCGEKKVNMLNTQTNELSGFEGLNIASVRKSTGSNKVHEEPVMHSSSHQKGAIPKYLSKRKAEQAEASARAKEIDPHCPEGHVVMPDNERRETFDMILKNYSELITELNKIPVRTDTLKMKQRKIEIERQLDKLEEGIRIFSRAKVFVKLDA